MSSYEQYMAAKAAEGAAPRPMPAPVSHEAALALAALRAVQANPGLSGPTVGTQPNTAAMFGGVQSALGNPQAHAAIRAGLAGPYDIGAQWAAVAAAQYAAHQDALANYRRMPVPPPPGYYYGQRPYE